MNCSHLESVLVLTLFLLAILHVTSEDVILESNALSGTLPNRLGQYSQSFQHIALNANLNLGGRMPSLSGLSNLRELHLHGTSLSGELFDPDAFADLGQLQVLEAGNAVLLNGVIPTAINMLTSLQKLSLENSVVEGTIPDSVGDMVSLGKSRVLDLPQGRQGSHILC